MKPRIFLGSSTQQAKLLNAIARGLDELADVEAWTTVFNPGVSTLDRLVELTREVDFAVFVFAHDDWTSKGPVPDADAGQASPRDNVVFEAGLFGGVLGMRRTFILHARGAKLPTDLLGLTSIRYDPDTTPVVVRQINQQLRKAIDAEGRLSRLEGMWWQLSLTARTELEPSAISLLRISRDRNGCARGRRALLGLGRHAVGALLERGVEGTRRSVRDLLLLEGRASAPPECPGTGRDRRDQARVGRSRERVLHHALGWRQRVPRQDVRDLCARRPGRHGRARR